MVQLTTNAITEVKRLLEKEAKAGLGLRIGVEKGGCSGFSYKLGFDSVSDRDRVNDCGGVKVMVDAQSLRFVDGSTIDFVDGLEGRGFRFLNPNAKGKCGCGESFSA